MKTNPIVSLLCHIGNSYILLHLFRILLDLFLPTARLSFLLSKSKYLWYFLSTNEMYNAIFSWNSWGEFSKSLNNLQSIGIIADFLNKLLPWSKSLKKNYSIWNWWGIFTLFHKNSIEMITFDANFKFPHFAYFD